MGQKILVVDDDKNIRKLLMFILEDYGYKFIEAGNGEEALDILKTEKVDLILLDLMMPLMGGYDTLINIRKNPSLSSIPVIIISAIGRKEDIEECLKMGAADYFTKPLKEDDIRFLVPLKVKNLIKLKLTREKLIQAEKLAGVACLAAGMAHEINNPLGGILQNLQLLDSRLKFSSSKAKEKFISCGFKEEDIEKLELYFKERKIYKYMDYIKEAGERAAKIVRNLLKFSQPREREFKKHNINLLVDDALAIAGSEYEMKKVYGFEDINIIKDYDKEVCLECEGQEIIQVILNLIKNAAYELYKFGKTCEDFRPSIKLKTILNGNYGIIQVSDNGPGIEEDIMDSIFDAFFTTKEVGEGTGLGLSISHFIVRETHRGNLRVETKKGKGTTFFVELPLGSIK